MSIGNRFTIASMAVAAIAGFAPLAHADHIFLEIPGIPGESTADKYPNWIEVTSMGQEFSRRSCGGLTVSKKLDKASPALAVSAVNGDPLAQATVVVLTGGDRPQETLRLVLNDLVIASTTIQSADPDRAVAESVRLLPRSVSITYRQQDPKGGLGPAITTVVTCNNRRQ
jgi:type VI protein secretion system component Hcp